MFKKLLTVCLFCAMCLTTVNAEAKIVQILQTEVTATNIIGTPVVMTVAYIEGTYIIALSSAVSSSKMYQFYINDEKEMQKLKDNLQKYLDWDKIAVEKKASADKLMPTSEIKISSILLSMTTLHKTWSADNKLMQCRFKSVDGKTALHLNLVSPQSLYNVRDKISMSFDIPSLTVMPELAKRLVDALDFKKIKAEWDKNVAAEKQGNELFN